MNVWCCTYVRTCVGLLVLVGLKRSSFSSAHIIQPKYQMMMTVKTTKKPILNHFSRSHTHSINNITMYVCNASFAISASVILPSYFFSEKSYIHICTQIYYSFSSLTRSSYAQIWFDWIGFSFDYLLVWPPLYHSKTALHTPQFASTAVGWLTTTEKVAEQVKCAKFSNISTNNQNPIEKVFPGLMANTYLSLL